MVDPMTENILLVGCMFMAAFTFGYEFLPAQDTKRFHYVAMGMTGSCCCGYLAMYSGSGITEVDGRHVFWARYVDWLFSTQFWLLGLTLLSGASNKDMSTVLAMDAGAVCCSLVGALLPAYKWPAFCVGAALFAAFIAYLCGPLQRSADLLGEAVAAKYRRLSRTSMLAWAVTYPVVYMLCEMTHTLDEVTEVALYTGCDVMAKCVCSALLLSSPEVLRLVAAGGGQKVKQALLD